MIENTRQGILAGGNFIVDHVKVIDEYPQQDMLASILSESQANGGGPYNVLKDLAAMKAGFPLEAAGLVGDDDNGRWIRQDCTAHGIDARQLRLSTEESTSYTDAMTAKSSGRRTFFHRRGANALLDVGDFDFTHTRARIFHLGYLMLLDRLDSFDDEGRTRASRVLENAKKAGLTTTVDMVSTGHPKFREIALSAMPFADHLIINEAEASMILHRTVAAKDVPGLVEAATELAACGVGQSVTIHTERGAVCVMRGGSRATVQASLSLPEGFSKGATGAGDAFAAGLLYGIHEGLPPQESLKLAVCVAACSLSEPTPSGGVRETRYCLELAERFGFGVFG